MIAGQIEEKLIAHAKGFRKILHHQDREEDTQAKIVQPFAADECHQKAEQLKILVIAYVHSLRLQAAYFVASAATRITGCCCFGRGRSFGRVDECGYDKEADTAGAGIVSANAGDELLCLDTGLDLEPDIA